MPLTPEQIAEMDKITGLGPTPDPHTDTSEIDAAIAAAPKPKPGIIDSVKKDFNTRVNTAADAQNKDQGAVSKVVQTVGQGAGFVGDLGAEAVKGAAGVVGDIASKVAPETSKKVSEFTKSKVKAVAESHPVQDTAKAYSDWKAAHPEAAANLEGIGNIASLLPIGKGAGMAGEAAGKVAGKAENMAINMGKNSAIKAEKNILNDAIEITKPVLDKKGSIGAFERAGQPGGVKSKGTLGTYAVEPSPRDIEVAKSVQGIVSKGKGPIDNIINVNQEIGRISEKEIKPFLQKNPAIFNKKTLNAHLQSTVQPADFIRADPVLQNTYNLARQRMLDVVDRHPKNMEGLWEARKEFDAIAEKQLGNLDPTSEKATAIKQAVLDTRAAVNDFIAQNTPNGDEVFKGKMKTLSHMYSARSNIAEQNYKLLDKNAIERWAKQNPGKAKLLGKITGSVALLGTGYEVLH